MDTITNPGGYREFLSDSIFLDFDYKTGEIFQEKYWFDKSYLNLATPFDSDRLFIVQYKYQFSNNNNNLRLDLQAHALFRTFIYKRIN